MATELRAVPADPAGDSGVLAAAESGDERALLIEMRRVLAERLDDPATPAHALGTLVNRQLDVCKELRALDAAEGRIGPAPAPRGGDGREAWDASAI
jgi:hypothetical protein